jgi:hypothetical protein
MQFDPPKVQRSRKRASDEHASPSADASAAAPPPAASSTAKSKPAAPSTLHAADVAHKRDRRCRPPLSLIMFEPYLGSIPTTLPDHVVIIYDASLPTPSCSPILFHSSYIPHTPSFTSQPPPAVARCSLQLQEEGSCLPHACSAVGGVAVVWQLEKEQIGGATFKPMLNPVDHDTSPPPPPPPPPSSPSSARHPPPHQPLLPTPRKGDHPLAFSRSFLSAYF